MTLSLNPRLSIFGRTFNRVTNLAEHRLLYFDRTSYWYLAENRVTIWQNIVLVFWQNIELFEDTTHEQNETVIDIFIFYLLNMV